MTDRFADYESYDATGLAELVRRGYLSPSELLETAIERIEERNPPLNAVIHRLYNGARGRIEAGLPDGPLHGVPFLIKDLQAALAGAPLEAGSRFLKGFVPDFTSALVHRYIDAGLVILGKTNTPEFGITPFTEPETFGPTKNPWDTTRTAGGSSGGSAAAVASGMVPVAHGGDGGGSIRIPASCCGLFGLKPTRGRTPSGPDHGYRWHGCVVEHVLTRTVRDSALFLDVTAGPDIGAPYFAPPPERSFRSEVDRDPGSLRIGFTDRPIMGTSVHPDSTAAMLDAAKLLESLGHRVEDAEPSVDGELLAQSFLAMICAEVWADMLEMGRVVHRSPDPKYFEPGTWLLAMIGQTMSAEELSHALRTMRDETRRISTYFETYDLLLTPTLATPPPKTGSLQPSAAEEMAVRILGRIRGGRILRLFDVLESAAGRVFDFIPYTPVFNITGQPAASVPLFWNDEGLPVGVQFVGRFADEAALFQLAGQLERARPWFDRRPNFIERTRESTAPKHSRT